MVRYQQSLIKGQMALASLTAQTKIVAGIVGIIGIFCTQNIFSFGLFALVIVFLCAVAHMSFPDFLRIVKPAAVILALSFIVNTFVFIGHPDIIFSGSVGISVVGFYRTTTAIIRVLLALALVLIVAKTTTPTELSDGFSALFLLLRVFHIDVDELSIVLSITLRAIPLILEELDKIRAAQRSRGCNFETGTLVQRIKKWSTLLVPLTVLLFKRADELAQAMTDRCLGAAKRTRLSKKMKFYEWAVLFIWIIFCVGMIFL